MGICNSDNGKNLKKGEYLIKKEQRSLRVVDGGPSQKVELFIFLKSNENAKFEVELFQKINNYENNLGRSKAFEGTTIDFMILFELTYYFEKEQELKLLLYKNSSPTEYKFTLGKVMGSRGQNYIFKIENGEISVQGKASKKSEEKMVEMKICLETSDEKKLEPLFYLEREISSNVFTKVYRSERNEQKKTHNFEKVSIRSTFLTDNLNNPFYIRFFNGSEQNKVGYQKIILTETEPNNKYELVLLSENGEKLNEKLVYEITMKKLDRFIDYLRGGLQISLIIGIDFTGSNQYNESGANLHEIKPNKLNGYEKAISSCGNIIGYYDYDQKFPVFGYGATLPGSSRVDHCFPINFEKDPYIQLIENILPVYRNCVSKISFDGPTNFSPIIEKSIEIVRENVNNYYVLMILTDGQITDMRETMNHLVQASTLPLSLIIIGIGQGDFGKMNLLDADENPLVDESGIRAARDLVQFVKFSDHQNDGSRLAEAVLQEIPYQIEEYYKMIKKPAGEPININFG
jgi:hypothetical protein